MRKLSILFALLMVSGCKTAPETKEEKSPTVTNLDATIDQHLTDFQLKLTGTVQSPEAARIERATYELVVDGAVTKAGEEALNVDIPAGGSAPFSLSEGGKYLSSAEELKTLSENPATKLGALRGKLFVKTASKTFQVEYAKSKEFRTPRLPKVKMNEAEGARYSDEEVNITFYLGVENPNAFPINLSGINYTASVAGKQLQDGKIGGGESVSPSSTGVFELQVAFTKDTYGADVKAKVKTNVLPYEVKGTASGDLFEVPFDLTGDLKLNVSK